jgi:hypothetical protein
MSQPEGIGPQSARERPALFVFEGGGYHFRTVLLPLALEGHRRFGMPAVVVTSDPADIPDEIAGSDFISVSDQVVPDCFKPFRKQTNGATGSSRSNNRLVRMTRSLVADVRKFAFWKRRAAALLDAHIPRAVFLQTGNYFEVPFLLQAARERGIPTIALQSNFSPDAHEALLAASFEDSIKHLSPLKRSVALRIRTFQRTLERVLYRTFGVRGALNGVRTKGEVTFFAVENDVYRDQYLNNGQRGEQLVVTGAPEDDLLSSYRERMKDPAARAEARRSLHLQPDRWLAAVFLANGPALWSAAGGRGRYEASLRQMLSALSTAPDVSVVIKVHPRELISNYNFLLEQGSDIQLLQFCDGHLLTAVADFVITDGSAVARWPMCVDTPSVILNLTANPLARAAAQVFGEEMLTKPGELEERVSQLRRDGASAHINHKRPLFRKYADGHACERILNLVRHPER